MTTAERQPNGDGAPPVAFPDDFNLADYFLFDRLPEGLGDKVALRFADDAFTYREVAGRSRALAAALERWTSRGDRVYLVLPDVPAFAWAFFGVLARGAVVTLGNPDAPIDDLAHVARYVGARVVVTTPVIAEALAERALAGEAADLRALLVVGAEGEAIAGEVGRLWRAEGDAALTVAPLETTIAGAEPRARVATHRDDHAIWLFTSGSTGRPKAAMHTHRDFAWNTELYARRTVGYRQGDVTVSVPRLFFGYATGTNLMFPFAVGATACLFAERPTPESLARAIARFRPTVVTNVPTMMGKLLDHDETLARSGAPRLDFSSVRFHLSAGEALPPALLARFRERFGADVYDGIGSAEMFHIYCSNRPGDIKPGSLGKVVSGYSIKILADDAEGPGAPELARGETGVLWVKGDSVALGYHQDRDKSWATFHGHWCRTGDLFRVDDEGYLWFAGRADDLLKVGGIWVAPQEVEACLAEHEKVATAAVIGVFEDGLVKPKAFVVLRPEWAQTADSSPSERSALAAELQEFVRARLSKYKYPRAIEFVSELPKNDRGKIDRRRLEALEAARRRGAT